MILNAIIDDHEYRLNVPTRIVTGAEDFFAQLDADMDRGWQMSREWVPNPNRLERCQIVADKLLTALEKENERLGMLMAGYILNRLPGVVSVELDTRGEIQNTQFILKQADPEPAPVSRPAASGDREVTPVFQVGKGYRFSVFDEASGSWKNSPLFATESDAERQRQRVLETGRMPRE